MGKSVEIPQFKMTYKQIRDQELFQAMDTLSTAKILSNQDRCRIGKVFEAFDTAIETIQNEFMESVHGPYLNSLTEIGIDVSKKEVDTSKLTEEQKSSYEKIKDSRKKAIEELDSREYTFEVLPLGPQHVSNIALSYKQVKALGGFYDETGEIRAKYFEDKAHKKLGLVPETPSA